MSDVTSDECIAMWQNMELRRYIARYSLRKAKGGDLAEDYLQCAWIQIWQRCAAGQTMEHYKAVAARAIRAAYMREWRARQRDRLAREMRMR